MNEMERLHRQAERSKAMYPPETRLVLNHMNDPQAVPDGMRGTVLYVDDIGQLSMKWDNCRPVRRPRRGLLPEAHGGGIRRGTGSN